MKVWQRWVGLFAAAVLLAATTSADAKPGYIAFPGHHSVELNLKSSHGYEIQIQELNRRSLVLTAYKHPRLGVYLIRHIRARDDGIEARFPGVGRVSVRFHPLGPTHREPGFFPPCHGGETVKQPGYFLGTIRFRGEQEYTAVHANRARGEIVTTAKEICKRSIFDDDSEPEPEENETRLFAYSRSGGQVVGFSASTLHSPLGTSTFFSGYVSERREGMTISRLAIAEGTEDDLVPGDVGDFPVSAAVTPSDPFHGSAVFQRQSGADNAWTGPLSVVLPGAGRVALAGPNFAARLCQGAGCRHGTRKLTALGVPTGEFLTSLVANPEGRATSTPGERIAVLHR